MSHTDPSQAAEHKQHIAGVFHRASSTYDRVGPGFFTHFGQRLVAHAALPLNARVLDVASGRGAVLFPAAAAVGPGGFVTGIDLAEGMAQETAREAVQRGISNVEVRRMDAEHLEFPDASFDAILCGFALFFFPQLERALAEFRRTLKPGGRIAVSTWGDLFNKKREWFDDLVKKYLPSPPPETPDPNPFAESDFSKPEGMEKIFREAGFAAIQVISETADFFYANREEWWETLWSHGARARLERIEKTGGPEALARFKAECLEQADLHLKPRAFQQSFQVLFTLAEKPM